MSFRLAKCFDITPNGVLNPGSPQDYREYRKQPWFPQLLRTVSHIRFWADWASLQPSKDFAFGDPANPYHHRLTGLDEQIRLANADGLRTILVPYRYPRWVNGTENRAAVQRRELRVQARRPRRPDDVAQLVRAPGRRRGDPRARERDAGARIRASRGRLRAAVELGHLRRGALRPLRRQPRSPRPSGLLRGRQRAQRPAVPATLAVYRDGRRLRRVRARGQPADRARRPSPR